jgi:hypothetical protein
MCYEFFHRKSLTEKAQQRDKPKAVNERAAPGGQASPAPVQPQEQKPEKVKREVETV